MIRDIRAAPDKYLLEDRRGGARRAPGFLQIGRHVAPAEKQLPFFRHNRFDPFFAQGAFDLVRGEKNIADAVPPHRRQVNLLFLQFFAEKFIGNLHENSRAVAGVRV